MTFTPANDNATTRAPIRFLSVCSGIEAASVAWHPLGWQCVGVSEIEPFPAHVLAHHYGASRPINMPDPEEECLDVEIKRSRKANIKAVAKLAPDTTMPNFGDFTKIDTTKLGRVDVLCGGTPCQAFSIAGLRGSLDDARGNLSLSFVKLAHELAAGNGLRNLVWENVLGVLSTRDNAFGCFLGALVGADDAVSPPAGSRWPNAGMVSGPKGRAAWRVLDAQFYGLAQRRKRVILVADFGNGSDPAAVLFERIGLQGNTPPSREARKDVAPTISARTKGGGGLGADFDLDGGLIESTYAPEIARCVATREGTSQDYESTAMVAAFRVAGDDSAYAEGDKTAPLTTGTDPSSNVIAFSSKDFGADASHELSPTLRAGSHSSSHANGGVMPAIAQTVAIRGRDGGATAELGGEVATALRASQGGGDKAHVLECRPINTMIAMRHEALGERTGFGIGENGDPSFTLTKGHSHAVQFQSAVRRLTPRECERLMGFPDDYTAIPYGHVSEKKLEDDYVKYMGRGNPKGLTRQEVAKLASDGPRYKSLGNSWAVPKFRWLGERIQRFMPQEVSRAA